MKFRVHTDYCELADSCTYEGTSRLGLKHLDFSRSLGTRLSSCPHGLQNNNWLSLRLFHFRAATNEFIINYYFKLFSWLIKQLVWSTQLQKIVKNVTSCQSPRWPLHIACSCLTNKEDKENQQMFTFQKLETVNVWHFCLKEMTNWLSKQLLLID